MTLPGLMQQTPLTITSIFERMRTIYADGQIIYVVQANDTLWAIAAVHGITVDELRALNGLTGNAALRAGDRVKLVVYGTRRG